MFRRAFTLVELLVVIAILGLLAAILFPVFARARENGRRASCQSNLRQIGLGIAQYSQDFDEVLIPDWFSPGTSPGATDPLGTPGGQYKWMDAAYPYIKSEQVFTCPSATGKRATPWKYYGNISAPTTDYGSYVIVHGYGPGVADRTPPVSHPRFQPIGELVIWASAASPTTTAWVVDGGENAVDTFYAQRDATSDSLQPLDQRHLDTLNVLFLDGHVKALKEAALNRKNSAGTIAMATIQDD